VADLITVRFGHYVERAGVATFVADVALKVHKEPLVRYSKYFKGGFNAQMVENATNTLNLAGNDVCPCRVELSSISAEKMPSRIISLWNTASDSLRAQTSGGEDAFKDHKLVKHGIGLIPGPDFTLSNTTLLLHIHIDSSNLFTLSNILDLLHVQYSSKRFTLSSA
jgi:hypothetical protein